MTIQQILLKYWGYSNFRPLQEEIITAVLNGQDTLALLPTGGGKSICFQVPALARKGICLVISPLIALMKDQVANLNRKGIPAAALYTGMHPREIDNVLIDCRNDKYKLLYVSPERLLTDKMAEAIRRMPVNLLAVDEAHCISQWGYDFRPPYLEIAAIRPMIPDIPVLALTATATPEVVTDIQNKLRFPKFNVFQKSFERKNLTYMVLREEDKLNRLLRILRSVKGPGIVYVRNRKQTKEVSDFLGKNGISADFYHAGLDPRKRDERQSAWTREERPVIVATNAFGMGIDKPNVRTVVHLDLPDSIEAYFQEAGRGGRDEKRAFAVLLYEEADALESRHNLTLAYPELKTIRDIYQALCNYYQIPVGMGRESRFEFDLVTFSEQYGFQPVIVYNSLRLLEKEGYIVLTEGVRQPPVVFIKAGKEELYRFQVENAAMDFLIKTLLRSYGGILSGFVPVNEQEIARRSNSTPELVRNHLRHLEKMRILEYVPGTDKPQVIFAQDRTDTRYLTLSAEIYENRRKRAEQRLGQMIAYCELQTKCRSQSLLHYFGETNTRRCGRCDVCIERNKISLNEVEFDHIVEEIKPLLRSKSCSLNEIVAAAGRVNEDKVLRAVQWLIENDKIRMDQERKYRWI